MDDPYYYWEDPDFDSDDDPFADDEDDNACPMCDGTGVFWVINMDTSAVRAIDCGDCNGTGSLTSAKEK